MPARLQLIGHRYGRLLVESESPARIESNGRRRLMWQCRCDCGKVVTVMGDSLRRGTSNSCGCLNREVIAHRLTTHGQAKGGMKSPEYVAWQGMLARCYCPSQVRYHRYGARGITVCDRWNPSAGGSFENFAADMGPRPTPGHSIDRIDGDGPYAPLNCRWATAAQQARNKRNNRWVTYKGQRMILTDAAKAAGLNRKTLSHRINAGWPEDQWATPPWNKGNHLKRKTET